MNRIIIILGMLMGLSMLPAHAHHAFSAEFDSDHPVHLEGTVTKVDWINPHAWIHVEVAKEDGSTENWLVEGGTPNSLFRRGITRKTLVPGTKIIIDGFRAKLDVFAAAGRRITFPDGTQVFLGTAGVGAPDDGAESVDK